MISMYVEFILQTIDAKGERKIVKKEDVVNITNLEIDKEFQASKKLTERYTSKGVFAMVDIIRME